MAAGGSGRARVRLIRRSALFVATAALVATACGSRVPSDVLASLDGGAERGVAVGSRRSVGTGDAASLPGADVGDIGAEGAGPDTAATDSGGGPAAGNTENASSGGPTAAGPAGPAADDCGAPGATGTGVTDKEIKVGSIVTASGPLPGATEGSWRGAQAYLAMINSMGGVCGRKVTLLKGDDGLDPARARAEFRRIEPQVLAFVGPFAVADSGYIDLVESTGVPYIGTMVEPEGRKARGSVPKLVDKQISTAPFAWWKKTYPDVTKAGLLYANVGGVVTNIPGTEAAIRKEFELAYGPTGVTVTNPDYTAEVRSLQDREVDFVYLFAFEVSMHARFVRNMLQQNYDPPIKGANIAFNNRFSELLGKDGDGWQNHGNYLPFLDPAEAGRSERLAEFVQWNERVFPGAQLDLFPVSGWGAGAYFVEALRTIKGPITRESLLEALYGLENYDAAGLNPPGHPTKPTVSPCFVMAEHQGGQWKRKHPADGGFECDLGQVISY